MPSEKELSTLRKLRQKKYIVKYGKLLIEGARFIKDALDSGRTVEKVYFTEGAERRYPDIIKRAKEKGVETERLSARVLRSISLLETPQGLAATVLIPPDNPNLLGKLLRPRKRFSFYLFLDEVQDPGNVGTIIRIADGLGIDCVILSSGCAGVFNPKTYHSSMGSIFRVSLFDAKDRNSKELLELFKREGFKLIGSDAGGKLLPEETELSDKNILIVGNEGKGVKQKLLDLCEAVVRIPTRNESLNVAVSTGIIVYNLLARRR
ncbi:RNA methyltransferase [bacterium]|nr:RNA methyltransferase [bacterium]